MAPTQQKPVKTKIIDNFIGRLTRYPFGDMNSGLAKYSSTYANECFGQPGTLSWIEAATQIDPSYSVLTDLIVAGKERVESGISYVYAIGHLGRLYKIQVNDPTTYNPSYDHPVLLATLTINSPTFTRGGSLDFFGGTEKIFIGHDMGVTSINFDGSGETFLGILGSWTQLVPRPSKQFLGKIYFGNGNNFAEIDSTATVSSYTRISPGFPSNSQVRDLDLSTDGNYLQAVVTRLALPDITSGVQDTTLISNSESSIFWWNGTDQGYTSSQSFPAFSLNANQTFGDKQYTFGYDIAGSVVYAPVTKILSPILSLAPIPNAIGSNGGFVAWFVPEFVQGFMRASLFLYGNLDSEVTTGWWRQYQQPAQGGMTDVITMPWQCITSNLLLGSVLNGYTNGLVGTGKVYFSTLETAPGPVKFYKLWKLNPIPTGVGIPTTGVYETQSQLFSGKVKLSEVRIYTVPLVTGNSFKLDIIGSDGNPISGGSKTFTVGTNASIGDDREWYDPQVAPTQCIGIRITNLGTVNWRTLKVEVDYAEGGE